MMMLNDKDTGAPLAMMSANLLSSYRTGGIPGVGCKYLAREDAKSVAIIGPGVMGKTSLRAFVSVRPGIDTVKIKGRGQKSIDSFVAFVKEECPGIKNIVICDSIGLSPSLPPPPSDGAAGSFRILPDGSRLFFRFLENCSGGAFRFFFDLLYDFI